MALVDWYILSVVCLAGAASPGPSWILLVNSVVKDGRKAGIAFGIAHGLGIFVYAALVAFGLMILISIAPWVSLVLEFIGLLFLLWLARSMIKNSFEIDSVNDVGSNWISRQLLEHARNGFLIVFLNPKVAVFFIAIFSQFLISASSLQGKMIMVITATLIDAGWYIFLALLLTVPKFKNHLQLNAEKTGFFLGVLLLIVSFVLAVNIIGTFF